jgi:hypothetical protein
VTPSSLAITFKKVGKQGKAILTATLPDGTNFTDTVCVTDASGRKRFLTGLCQGRKGIDRPAVAVELERIAAELAQQAEERRASQADLLAELIIRSGAECFHAPGGHDAETFATVSLHGHRETWPIKSTAFGRYLSRLYYEQFEKVPGAQAVQDAKNLLAGKAAFDGPEYPVAVRLAEHDGAIYLDLADQEWRSVRVTANGWEVVAETPVKFVRRRGMLALPAPARGGSLAEFFALANLPTEELRLLFLGWLVKAFRPDTPFPVLNVNGEQGSAKSTLCRMARDLIDPNQAPLRRPPRNEQDLMIAASNGWVVAYDNLSGISAELSDALCCLSTGGGFGARELFTDDEEKLFRAKRPVIINGIDDVVWRADLLDRSINLTLPVIDEGRRQDEESLWARFDKARPRILGAVLDAVVVALTNLARVRLANPPRMADFARWVVAAEPALGASPGRFMQVYRQNRGEADSQLVEHSEVAQVVVRLIAAQGAWHGTATELLSELNRLCTDEATRKEKHWPKNAGALSKQLRRLAPVLRRGAAINVIMGERDDTRTRNKIIRLERACNLASGAVQPSGAPDGADATDGISHGSSNSALAGGGEAQWSF